MESVYFINLIFIFVLNLFFFFSGICLNSVVIISFWRSVQLRKRLCYFMIMVLSCCDFLGVITTNPFVALIAMLFMTGNLDAKARWPHLVIRSTNTFPAASLLTLLVMNFDRYLATSYPIFHRTSVTKKRLFTLFAVLVIIEIALAVMSVNDSVISYFVHIIIFFAFVSPTMLFLNYELLLVVRKNRHGKRVSPKAKITFSLKNISSCLLAVACYVTLSIPALVYAVGLSTSSTDKKTTFGSSNLTGYWSITIVSMNSTLNCLIFFWKNRVLRAEGWKFLKSMRI